MTTMECGMNAGVGAQRSTAERSRTVETMQKDLCMERQSLLVAGLRLRVARIFVC